MCSLQWFQCHFFLFLDLDQREGNIVDTVICNRECAHLFCSTPAHGFHPCKIMPSSIFYMWTFAALTHIQEVVHRDSHLHVQSANRAKCTVCHCWKSLGPVNKQHFIRCSPALSPINSLMCLTAFPWGIPTGTAICTSMVTSISWTEMMQDATFAHPSVEKVRCQALHTDAMGCHDWMMAPFEVLGRYMWCMHLDACAFIFTFIITLIMLNVSHQDSDFALLNRHHSNHQCIHHASFDPNLQKVSKPQTCLMTHNHHPCFLSTLGAVQLHLQCNLVDLHG